VNQEYRNPLFRKQSKFIFFDLKRKNGVESSTIKQEFKPELTNNFGTLNNTIKDINYLESI
jgi:hypothetical protein